MGVFGAVAVTAFLLKGLRRKHDFRFEDDNQGPKRRGGYFAAWRLACEKKGLAGRSGWTLKRQLAEMNAPPAFGDDLRDYHYSVRYEDKPSDTNREERLVTEIKHWD